MKIEWTEPVTVSSVFDDEQRVRVQALRVAAEVTTLFKSGGFTTSTTPWAADEVVAFLLTLADWIVSPNETTDSLIENGLTLMLAAEKNQQQNEEGPQ